MTADNPYTGETAITIGEKPCTLVFDFRALAKIHAQYGSEAIKNFFGRDDIWQHSPDMIADFVVAGLHKNHSEVTRDMVLDGLPAYAMTVAALSRALVLAYFGTDFAKEDDGEKDRPADESKKK